MTYRVEYAYGSGKGGEIVEAATPEAATDRVMAAATPRWNPGATVRHTRTYRVLWAHEVAVEPHGGLRTAVDLTWYRRDRGGPLLVVERGHGRATRPGRRAHEDYWTDAGVIVGTATTRTGARRMVTRARRRGFGRARYDIVPRGEVEISLSGQPYGCIGC